MSEEIFKALIPGIIALLIIWLIYRIKNQIKLVIKNEIYDNFPTIKDTIANFEHRIEYLNTQTDLIERKIKEFEDKARK